MIRIVVQNTAVGIVLGWLYWKWGLESAMLAHFFFDVALYVVTLPVLQFGNPLLALAALVGLALVVRWARRAVAADREGVE
jgi:hypothetical protein